MTIRYECDGCQSVLKIRDELAGTKAKCPKCKTAFVIPSQSAQKKKAKVAATTGPTEEEADPIDMPQEITPIPDLSLMHNESAAGMTGSGPSIDAVPADNVPKPSIAELMREHEEQRKKKKDKKKKGGLAEAAAAAEVMTSGTAADALTRNYDQKRGKAGEPPPLTREERREAENRAALFSYAKKAIPVAIGLAVAIVGFFTWYYAEPLPELGYVTGVVTQGGSPVTAGYEIQFVPLKDPNDAGQDKGKKDAGMRNPSTGYTDDEGRYILKYNEDVEGAILGEHRVYIRTSSQVDMYGTGSEPTKTVVDGDNNFDFSLP